MTGAPASRSGSRPTGQAQGLGATRFDPSRMVRLGDSWCPEKEEIYGDVIASDIDALLAFAHAQYDWQPIASAPKDGSIFLVHSDKRYDFAQYDTRHNEFVKWGCGWEYATEWAPLTDAEMPK